MSDSEESYEFVSYYEDEGKPSSQTSPTVNTTTVTASSTPPPVVENNEGKENNEKVNLRRLSRQLNTIRPTLQYAYFMSLTIVLRENAALQGNMRKFLGDDGLGNEGKSLEEQAKMFNSMQAQSTDKIIGTTKTTNQISDIQMNFEEFLVDIRKFMLNLISVSYRIFHLNQENMRKQIKFKNSSPKLQLYSRKGLIRMVEQSKVIVGEVVEEIDSVLNLLDTTLLDKTKQAIGIVNLVRYQSPQQPLQLSPWIALPSLSVLF
jgi:hypothetical protein